MKKIAFSCIELTQQIPNLDKHFKRKTNIRKTWLMEQII